MALTAESDARPLLSRSFLGLLVTQFLGAVNDNMFRWLVVPIGKQTVAEDHAAVALSLGLAAFVVPFLLLAAVAGYLADRYSKRTIIVACKVAELAIMGLGICSILSGSLYVMLGVIALMGAQSALFGPSKFGSIPELVPREKVAAANGLIGMTTVVAIVLGTIAGNLLYGLTTQVDATGALLRPAGQHRLWLSAAALLGVSTAGLLASLWIQRLPVANPHRSFPYRFAKQTVLDLKMLAVRRALLRAALGAAVFWTLAAIAQMNVDLFAITELRVDQFHVGILLGILALGVGTGSVVAGLWSSGRIELGLVPLGAAGIALGAVSLFATPDVSEIPGDQFRLTAGYVWSCLALFLLGASSGLYNIPIQAFLQSNSPPESRGSILAANNFLAQTGMLAAAGLFWLAQDVAGWSAREIFLSLGVATIPVLIYVVLLLPGATARIVVWILSKTIYRVRVHGGERLTAEQGVLLLANHVSYIDGVLLLLYLPRPPRIIARADPGQGRLYRKLADDLGTIFLTPGKRSILQSLETARDALRDGDLVCIFPEGRISKTGEVGKFNRGFVTIAEETDVPVLPVCLKGLWGSIFSWEGAGVLRKLPRRWSYPVDIVIGAPLARPLNPETAREAVMKLEAGSSP